MSPFNRFRRFQIKTKNFFAKIGPGLVTGASDDDPSGIATYTQAGAGYGLNTLWTALITFPLMTAVQEMCARIGLSTGKGIGAVIKANYPRWFLYLVTFFTVPAVVINIGADLAGMGAVLNLLFPFIPTQIFTFISGVAIIFAVVLFSYKKLESVMKWLTLVLFVYFIVPFMVQQDAVAIFKATVIPHFEFSAGYIAIIVAILGTTISPYLFFWEASMEVESHKESRKLSDFEDREIEVAEVKEMRVDNFIGMFFSQIVMYFIILTAGSVLFKNGLTQIATVEQAAQALQPIAGDFAYLLFAVGVIGTGFLAVPVLSGSMAYLVAETFDWQEGMNKKLREAKGFYGVIISSILVGIGMNTLGVNPIEALIFTAVVYGLLSPFLIMIIIHICNNQKIMGKWTNKWLANTLGIICVILLFIAAFALILSWLGVIK